MTGQLGEGDASGIKRLREVRECEGSYQWAGQAEDCGVEEGGFMPEFWGMVVPVERGLPKKESTGRGKPWGLP